MKIHTKLSAGFLLGIILTGLIIVPVSASDDSSWLNPGSLDDILAWMKTTSQQVPAVPSDSSGLLPEITPSYTPTDDSFWASPASQEQIIAWSKMIARQTAATAYPSTLSQADRIRLFKSYNSGGAVLPAAGMTVTPLPATEPVPPAAGRFSSQKPITMPATPYYMPSAVVTVVPTQSPSTGSVVSGNGIMIAELNLQGKYVRIVNTGAMPVVMTGWKITNNQGNSLNFIDFPRGDGSTFTYVLNPYSTLTVYFGKEGIVTANELYYPYGTDFWNPQGDTASLYNPQGELIGRTSA
jgi:hypothetical protein